MNKREEIIKKEFKSIEKKTEQNRTLVNTAKRNFQTLQSLGTLVKVRPVKIIMVLDLMSKRGVTTEKDKQSTDKRLEPEKNWINRKRHILPIQNYKKRKRQGMKKKKRTWRSGRRERLSKEG